MLLNKVRNKQQHKACSINKFDKKIGKYTWPNAGVVFITDLFNETVSIARLYSANKNDSMIYE